MISRLRAALGRRAARRRRGTAQLDDLATECDRVSAEALDLVAAADHRSGLDERWLALHARLVDLELRTTAAAEATHDPRSQRPLDQLAGALIALRGALEKDVDLHARPDIAPAVVAAGDDVVTVRCDDIHKIVRSLSSGP